MSSIFRSSSSRSRHLRSPVRHNALSLAVAGLLATGAVGHASAQSLHWDGGDSSRWDNGTIDGGAGTWHANTRSFTNTDGSINSPQDPSPGDVKFGNTGGIVTVDNSAGEALVTGMHFTVTDYDLRGDAIRMVGNNVEIRVGNGGAADDDIYTTIRSELTGDGGLVKTGDGNLWLAGTNSYTGNTRVEGGLLVGDANSIRGNLVNNAQALFRVTSDQVYAGNITGTGVMGKMGGGVLELTGTSALEWDIVEGGVITAADRFSGDAFIEGGAWLVFWDNTNATYDGILGGSGDFDVQLGQVRLTGNSVGFTGSTWVSEAELIVDGVLGGTLDVLADGALSGAGSVGDTQMAGNLRGVAGQTLTFGSLVLAGSARTDVALAAPGGATLFNVQGNLTLDGTLNVSDAGGFGDGIYRLFDYSGNLIDNGLDIGTVPGGVDATELTVQTSVAHQVNLLYAAAGNGGNGGNGNSPTDYLFWDGSDSLYWANGAIDGGNGTWRSGEHSFANVDGSVNNDMQPVPGFVIFQGAAGTVTVDNAGGNAQVTGMQFATDGYVVQGDAIALHGDSATIRVGDGSASGASMVATVSSSLTGSAGLVKNDLGTLVLRGDNAYTGGTTVQAGTLVGDAGSIRGALVNHGSVIFDQNDNDTFAGNISGSGGATKIGTGVLTLSGDSSLDWRIDEGAVRTAAGRFSGDAQLGTGTSLEFAQAANASYAGVLSGDGLFRISGNGALTLTGNSNGFAGQTLLDGGSLAVNGRLGAALTVASAARLSGIGHVGDATINGTIAPGSASTTGTLNVTGNLVFGAGATYEAKVDAQGNHDRIAVTGNATLQGGSVLALASAGNYAPLTSYTLLSAAGGVQGQFGTVSSSLAFLTPSLDYSANDVTLRLERNALAFPDVAVTGNQAGVAGAVESLGMGNDVHDAVVVLDESDAIQAFDRLSGELHASAARMLLEDSRFIREASLSQARGAIVGTPLQKMVGGERNVWVHGIGSWASRDARDGVAKAERSRLGVIIGGDVAVGDAWTFGLSAGHGRATLTTRERGASADFSGYQLALYGGWQEGAWGVRFGAAQSWDNVDTSRNVVFNGYDEQVRATYDSRTTQVFAEAAYSLKFKDAVLEPYVNAAHVTGRSDDIDEQGGAAALRGRSDASSATFYSVGLRGERDFESQRYITLRGGLAWQDVTGMDSRASLAFDRSDLFQVRDGAATDAFVADLGIEGEVGRNARLGLAWNGTFGSGIQDNGLRLRMDWKF